MHMDVQYHNNYSDLMMVTMSSQIISVLGVAINIVLTGRIVKYDSCLFFIMGVILCFVLEVEPKFGNYLLRLNIFCLSFLKW